MTLIVGDHIVQAFEAQEQASEPAAFAAWWHGHAAQIGPGPATHEQAVAALAAARGAAAELGITDNEDNRIFLQAVALRLMPQMTGTQYLLAADVLFLETDDAARIAELVAIAKRPD